jgi:hypothetical protein
LYAKKEKRLKYFKNSLFLKFRYFQSVMEGTQIDCTFYRLTGCHSKMSFVIKKMQSILLGFFTSSQNWQISRLSKNKIYNKFFQKFVRSLWTIWINDTNINFTQLKKVANNFLIVKNVGSSDCENFYWLFHTDLERRVTPNFFLWGQIQRNNGNFDLSLSSVFWSLYIAVNKYCLKP